MRSARCGAAEAVAGNFDTLLDTSLVSRNGERFELHEVTRQFAEEKMGAKKKAHAALAAYFAKCAGERAQWNERASFAVILKSRAASTNPATLRGRSAIALDNVDTAYYYLGNKREAFYYLRQSIREARDIKADFIALDALVWVAGIQAQRGELEKAIELWSLIRHHPKTDPETIQSLKGVMTLYINGVIESQVYAAEERGRSMDLSFVLDEALK